MFLIGVHSVRFIALFFHHHLLFLQLLLRHLLLLRLLGFGHSLFLFGQDNLDVTRATHVRGYTPMSAVGPSSHLWCSVHLDMIDNQMVSIQSLELGVAFCVLQHLEEKLG